MALADGIRKDWLEKDFYKALGVPKDADGATIKKEYRKLARKLHPDASPGNKQYEERFKEVSQAYDVLSDKEQRAKYDEARELYGSGGFRFPGTGRGGRRGGAPQADYGDIFGQGNQGGSGFSDVFSGLFNRGGGSRQPRRGADLESKVTLSFDDALYGVTLPLQLTSDGRCRTCLGSGAKPGTTPRVCPTCQGSGGVTRNAGGFAFAETCDECRGRGVLIDDPCTTCHGTGEAAQTRTVHARVPAGVKHGQRIRLKGKGAPGMRGGPNGDLFIVVKVTPDAVFGRDGDNVTLTLPVGFDEAALGAQVVVPTPEHKSVILKVPAGTSNGRTFRVRGKGAPTRNGGVGDLLVTVIVAVPRHLSDDARAAIEAYRAATVSQDLRADLLAKTGVAGGGD